VGQAYAAWAGLDDPVIEIGVTPNRGDALSVRGIARDLAAAGLGTLLPWDPIPVPAQFETPIRWDIAWTEACPWVLGRSIRNLRNGPSPDWLRRRLVSVGLRPISALVDITNFFTVDLGRPLHVFDAGRIAGSTLTLRRGAGERFAALNGRDVETGPEDLVIADADGVCSLAGIMGGAASGTTEATTHVFVECALFDPVVIARTGRRHQLHSDARQRFERGVDPALPPAALEAATRMILELCGGEAGSVASAGAEPAWRRTASLRFERIAGLGGASVSPEQATGILERLGFAPAASLSNATITVDVPSWRNDIAGDPALDQSAALPADRATAAAEGAAAIEPECDLLEEVLRIAGLDNIPAVSLPRAAPIPRPTLSPRQARSALARRAIAERGFAECVTFSFMAKEDAAAFGPVPEALTLKNPIAADLDQMRPTPLATLALAAARNAARGARQISLFEVGPGFSETGQHLMAAGLRAGPPPRHWQGGQTPADAHVAKADAWAVLGALGVPMESLTVTADAPAHFHPGQSGLIRQGPKLVLARFGALHPALIARLGLPGPAIAFELFLDAVADPKRRRRAAPTLPALQPVFRDFAFVVPRDVPAEAVLRAARGAERGLVAEVSLFDVYEGGSLPAGHKSLGVEIVLQPRDRTLSEQDIDTASSNIVAAVTKATGAHLR
jgi:phenylalanyl-tRNA synthetase beta chain